MRKLALPLAAVVVLIVAGTAGGASAGGTLVFGGVGEPTYLDPALVSDGVSFTVTEQIFEGLVRLKPGTTKIVPAMATKWKLTGGKTWTFWLRKGVKFHDGTPWNAAAACANFNRWYNWSGPFQDPSATFYYQTTYGGFRHNEIANLSPPLFKSCATRGKYKIVVKLNRTSGVFFPSLVISSFAMQSPTAMKKYGADQATLSGGTFKPTGTYAFQHPTGTGPFKFSSWTIGQKVELVRNAGYWGKKPKLDKIVIRPIADNEARFQALKTGEINAFDLAPPQDIGSLSGDANLKANKGPAFDVTAHSAPWRPTYVPKVNEGSAGDLNMIGWTGDYGDPDNFLGTFFRNYNPQFGFHNPAIEGILNRALNEPNFPKRVALYQKANVMIMKFLPGVPYAHATPALGAEKRIAKLIATPVGGVWFQFASVGGQ